MKVKVGQIYRIINNDSYGFPIGAIVRITEIYGIDSFYVRVISPDTFIFGQYIHRRHIQEIIPEINKNIKIL